MSSRGITGGILIIIVMGSLVVFGAKPMMLALEGVMFGNYPVPSKATEMKGYIQEVCRGGEGDYKSFETPPPYVQIYCEDCATLSAKAAFRSAVGAIAAASMAVEITDLAKGLGQKVKNVKARFAEKLRRPSAMAGKVDDVALAGKNGAVIVSGKGLTASDDVAKSAGKLAKGEKVDFVLKPRSTKQSLVTGKKVTSYKVIAQGDDIGKYSHKVQGKQKASRLKMLNHEYQVSKWDYGFAFFVGMGTGYVSATVGAIYPNLFYEISGATSELQDDLQEILESDSHNIPTGIDRVIVVKVGTSADSGLESIVENDQPQIKAAQARQVFQSLIGEMHGLFKKADDTSYAVSHFTQKTSITPTYIVQIVQDEGEEMVVVRPEHAERLWLDIDNFVSYRLDAMAKAYPDDAKSIAELKARFSDKWETVLGYAVLSHDPWTFVVMGMSEPADEIEAICAIEEKHDYEGNYVCDWYFELLDKAVQVEKKIVRLEEINSELLEVERKVLSELRSSDCGTKKITVTETFPSSDDKVEGLAPQSYTNTVELAKCALRVNCDYDTKYLTSSEGCVVETLNIHEEGIKAGERVWQMRGIPVLPLDYGQTYTSFGIQAASVVAGVISGTAGRAVGTLAAVIGNCGTLGNKGMVFCLQNVASQCTIPEICSVCYTVECGVPISCNPSVAGSVSAEHKGDKVEVLGPVRPL